MSAGKPPTTRASAGVEVPPDVVDELLGYALQTAPGAALWRGWLLGKGLPKGRGQITVNRAVYRPEPAEPAEATEEGKR